MQSITQSAASQRLREAERRLGIALTVKQGRSLVLSGAAEHLVSQASDAERALIEAEAQARWLDKASGTRWRLVVTIFDTFDFIPPFSEELRKLGISLSILHRAPEQVGALLASGLADALVTPAPLAPTGLPRIKLFTDELVAICSPRHPLAQAQSLGAEQIAEVRYLTYNDHPGVGFEYEQFFGPIGTMPGQIERFESLNSLVAMVAAGLGVSILPRYAVQPMVTLGQVLAIPLSNPTSLDWCLVHRSDKIAGLDISDLSELLLAVFRAGVQGEQATLS